MVGNIASGKSTYVKDLVKKGYVVIYKDGIRYSIGGGKYIFNPKYENAIDNATETLFMRFLDMGLNIVIDETNINKNTRAPYIINGQLYKYKITAVVTPKASLKLTLKRRMKDKNHGNQPAEVWGEVFTKKQKAYEKPTKKEGFDEVISLRNLT